MTECGSKKPDERELNTLREEGVAGADPKSAPEAHPTPSSDVMDAIDVLTEQDLAAVASADEADMMSEEEEEREVYLSEIISSLRFEIPSKNIRSFVVDLIVFLRQKFPDLTESEIREIITCKLEDAVMEEAADLDLSVLNALELHKVMMGEEKATPELLKALPALEAFLIAMDISFSEAMEEYEEKKKLAEVEETAQPEEDDGGGDDDAPVSHIYVTKQQESQSTHSAQNSTRTNSGKTQSAADKQRAAIIKSTLKPGTLTRQMDLEFYESISKTMFGSTPELKFESLSRIVQEWNFESGKPAELFSIAMYLLSYLFRIPPYFNQRQGKNPNKKRLEELGTPLKLFLKKTKRLNVQSGKDPMLKTYYPRFMQQVGHSIIDNTFEYEGYFGEETDPEHDEKIPNNNTQSSEKSDPTADLEAILGMES